MVDEDVDGGSVALAWARALIDAVVDAGVDVAVVVPGGRSTPLVLAAFDHDRLEVRSHLDERSAAYFALGRGRMTGRPTALITTSGTATANALPAVIEAHEAQVPLLILTADRPPELHDTGANQTIDQADIYEPYARFSRTLGEPSLDAHRLRSVRTLGARAIADATTVPAGPVHLNCPFRKPLEPPAPTDRSRAYRLARGDTPSMTGSTLAGSSGAIHELATRWTTRDRRLIVVGPAGLDAAAADAIVDLATASGAPIVADVASGVRTCTDDATVLAGVDGYLDAVEASIGRPDVVLRIGPPPVSSRLREYLDAEGTTQLAIDPTGDWHDPAHRVSVVVRAEVAPVASALEDLVDRPGDLPFVDTLETAEATYWRAVDEALDGRFFEGAIANRMAATTPGDAVVFAGNSMPIRDLGRFGRPRPGGPQAVANRGASGIDGTISTALGAGEVAGGGVVALVGDLAAYHDANGLLAVDRFGLDARIVVVNNDGGGIFHQLPVEAHDPPFESLFRTPHGLTFASIAEQYGLSYTAVTDRASLERALAGPVDGGELIECHVDAAASHRTRSRITDRVAETVRDGLP